MIWKVAPGGAKSESNRSSFAVQNKSSFDTMLLTVRYCQVILECCALITTLQNYAYSTVLDEYVFKMALDIQIGSLSVENSASQ